MKEQVFFYRQLQGGKDISDMMVFVNHMLADGYLIMQGGLSLAGPTDGSTDVAIVFERDEQGERCEGGCKSPVTHHDIEGVPLCEACWNELGREEPPIELVKIDESLASHPADNADAEGQIENRKVTRITLPDMVTAETVRYWGCSGKV